MKPLGTSNRSLLQPRALAALCVALIALLFIMRLFDLRTINKTLESIIENRGLDIIQNIQKVSELHYRQIIQAGQTVLDTNGVFLSEKSFTVEEELMLDLIEAAHEIDLQIGTRALNKQQMLSITDALSLWLFAVFDEQGAILFENRPIPAHLIDLAVPVFNNSENFKIKFFNQDEGYDAMVFFVLQRKSGKGTLLMALDGVTFYYWGMKSAIQRAIEDVGQIGSGEYFLILDDQKKILTQFGVPSNLKNNEGFWDPISSDNNGISSRKIESDDNNWFEIITPLYFSNGFRGLARLGLSWEREKQILMKNRRSAFISMFFIMCIASLSIWFLYKNQNIHLLKLQKMEKRLYRAERLSALGRLAAGVAHEIRNPLNAISMASQRLHREKQHPLTGVIRDEIRRLNQIIEEFLGFSKSRKQNFKPLDLHVLLKQILLLVDEEAESKGIIFELQASNRSFLVFMDGDKIKQAILNIINNGMESIQNEGRINISLKQKNKKWVIIKISDTGSGLTSEELDHIFELDYTTKDKGLGLGLPLAHEIIRGHGGEIRVRSRQGMGTTFEIILPFVFN